jgi:hypothetical protein
VDIAAGGTVSVVIFGSLAPEGRMRDQFVATATPIITVAAAAKRRSEDDANLFGGAARRSATFGSARGRFNLTATFSRSIRAFSVCQMAGGGGV